MPPLGRGTCAHTSSCRENVPVLISNSAVTDRRNSRKSSGGSLRPARPRTAASEPARDRRGDRPGRPRPWAPVRIGLLTCPWGPPGSVLAGGPAVPAAAQMPLSGWESRVLFDIPGLGPGALRPGLVLRFRNPRRGWGWIRSLMSLPTGRTTCRLVSCVTEVAGWLATSGSPFCARALGRPC